MPEENDLHLPFLTRHMLEFAHGLSFSLRITTQADNNYTLTIRGMTREGVFSFNVLTVADGSATTTDFRIPDVPIIVSVFDRDGYFDQGACYVSLSLVANEDILYQLCSGFVYKAKTIGYPRTTDLDIRPGGGKIEWITSDNPVAGTEASITCPNSEQWRVLAVHIELTTDATVANRRLHVLFGAANRRMNAISYTNQTASQTINYSVIQFGSATDQSDDGRNMLSMPSDMWISGTEIVGTDTTNIQAGDDFGIMRVCVEKFFVGVGAAP